MDFELSAEHEQFRQVLRRFVDDDIVPVARDWEHSGRDPVELVATMRSLGLFGLTVPEEHGGLGADFVSLALVFEEISRGWMGLAGILGTHSVSCWMLGRYGTDDQKRRYLPGLATGERRTGIALTEPGAGTDLQGISTRARREGDHYVVVGTKTWITNARHADPLPVLAKTDPAADPPHRGMSVLLVDAGTPGFEVSRDLPKLGYKGTETCEVVLRDVPVPAENLLGGVEGRGLQQVLSALETGRLNIAARGLGIAQRALDESLMYARDRHAFGRPIGDFQAVQARLADTATTLQAARLLTYWAARRLDRGERADLETGMAKLYASEVAVAAAGDAMRVFGSYGYSTEFEIERLFRDSMLLAIGEGTNDVLRTVVARSLLTGRGRVGW